MSEEKQEMPTQETPKAEDAKQEEAKSESPLKEFLKHQSKACEETGKALGALIPPDFRTHGHAAKEEFLTSFKVLVDGVSEMVDREVNKMRGAQQSGSSGSGPGPSTTGKTKVKVEVT